MPFGRTVRRVRAALAADDARRLPDAELLARFAADRDETAFAALVERHAGTVRGVCRRLTDPATADDAAQAVFLLLARKARSVRRPEALPSWLHGVAVRVARKAAARRRPAPALPDDVPASGTDPAAAAAWGEVRRLVDDAVARLPDPLRLPVILCYLDGLTRDEAAARLGWPAATFRGRLERGREKLRADLARRGLPLAAVLTTTLAAPPPGWAAAVAAVAAGRAAPSAAVRTLATGGLPAMTRWAVLASAAALAAAAGVALTAGPPAPPRVYAPDPKAPPTPAELAGDWVFVQDYPDRTGRKTWQVRFVDGTHAVWSLAVESAVVNQTITSRRTYAFGKADEVTFTTVERFVFDEPMRTETPQPPAVMAFRWENKERTAFTLTPRPTDSADKPTPMTFRKAEPEKVTGDVPGYLANIDRTIRKEPAYASKTPGYLLLAFGAEAKFRVWVVWDGDALYVDRNRNGDLTDADEKLDAVEKRGNSRVFVVPTLTAPDGTVYQNLVVSAAWKQDEPNTRTPRRDERMVMVRCDVPGCVQKTGVITNGFADRAAARVVHLDSPRRVLRRSQSLPPSLDANEPGEFAVELGTPGIGHSSFATCGGGGKLLKAHPVAEFAFPAAKTGDPPVKLRVVLDQRRPTAFGVIDQFVGAVTVPPGVGPGPATVTLSYPDCPLGKVEPVTTEVWYRSRK